MQKLIMDHHRKPNDEKVNDENQQHLFKVPDAIASAHCNSFYRAQKSPDIDRGFFIEMVPGDRIEPAVALGRHFVAVSIKKAPT